MIFFTDWKEEGTSVTHRVTLPVLPIHQITRYLQEVSILILFSLSINQDKICKIRDSVQQMTQVNLLPPLSLKILQADKSNLPNFQRKMKIQILWVRKGHKQVLGTSHRSNSCLKDVDMVLSVRFHQSLKT